VRPESLLQRQGRFVVLSVENYEQKSFNAQLQSLVHRAEMTNAALADFKSSSGDTLFPGEPETPLADLDGVPE